MKRTQYMGTVRDGKAEEARDARMLALFEQGMASAVIAQRMGVTVTSVRARIKRAQAQRDGAASAFGANPSGKGGDDAL